MTQKQPQRVTIILVNYNSHSDTIACLKSLVRCKNADLDLQVVVVDNASTDSGPVEQFSEAFSPCHVIKNKENLGFGRANNVGMNWALKHANPDYICLLNNDTIVEPDFIQFLIKPFEIDPEIGITTGKIHYNSKRDLVWYGGGEINKKRGWPIIQDINKEATALGANLPRQVTFISGCLMLFSKASLSDLRGFEQDMFMYFEDVELSIRAVKEGYKLYYEPRSVIYHKVQGSLRQEEEALTGYNPRNPNLGFLFANMQLNLWKTYKLHKEYFDVSFKFNYWIDFVKRLGWFVLHGRWDMMKVAINVLGKV